MPLSCTRLLGTASMLAFCWVQPVPRQRRGVYIACRHKTPAGPEHADTQHRRAVLVKAAVLPGPAKAVRAHSTTETITRLGRTTDTRAPSQTHLVGEKRAGTRAVWLLRGAWLRGVCVVVPRGRKGRHPCSPHEETGGTQRPEPEPSIKRGLNVFVAGFETCFGWDPLSYHWIRDVFWLGPP